MNSGNHPGRPAAALQVQWLKSALILLISGPLLLAWKYLGSQEFYLQHVGPRLLPGDDLQTAAVMYRFLSCLAVMGVLPAIVVKFMFRQRLADYGVRLGIPLRTLRSLLVWAPVFLLAGYVASRIPAFQERYPLNSQAGASPGMFALHALGYFAFYLGWEFYFRGFMLVGLRDSLGVVNALLIQTLASALLHIGEPALEAFAAIFGGLLWGALAVRNRSLLAGLLQHALLGISLDWFLCFGR